MPKRLKINPTAIKDHTTPIILLFLFLVHHKSNHKIIPKTIPKIIFQIMFNLNVSDYVMIPDTKK